MDTEKERDRLNQGIELLDSIEKLVHDQEESDYWFVMSLNNDSDTKRYKSRKNARERLKRCLESKYRRIGLSSGYGKH